MLLILSILRLLDPLQLLQMFFTLKLRSFAEVNATYSFNYTNTLANPAIIDGQIQNVTTDSSLVWLYQNNGNGNYQININTSAMDVIGTPYSCVFNISSTGNQTQPINFNLNIQISPSSLTILILE